MDPNPGEHEGPERVSNLTGQVSSVKGNTAPTNTFAITALKTTQVSSVPIRGGIQQTPKVTQSKLPQPNKLSNFTVKTPIDIDRLELELSDHPDMLFVENLCRDLREGTRIDYTGPRAPCISKNLPSAYQNPRTDTLAQEVALGRVAGPFDSPPLPNLQVSPIRVIPKKHSDKFRLIFHLSHPKSGDSINSCIPKEDFSLQYTKIDNAITALLTFGPGTYIAKSDIESAFHIFPINKEDWELLGMLWDEKYYVDMFLPFGLRSAPFKFNNLSLAIAWILLYKCPISYVDFILDDFLVMESPAKHPPYDQPRRVILNSLLLTLKNLGIPISFHKTEGPSKTLHFLGILLDSINMEARLPEDKVTCLRAKLSQWSIRKSAIIREIQSLIGTLNFACRVIPPGRPFLQQIIQLTHNVTKPHHYIRLNAGVRKGIKMWQSFLPDWNGSSFFLNVKWETSDSLHLYTDAASTIGYGGIFGTQWFQGKWLQKQMIGSLGISIDWQELYAIVVTCKIWGKHWTWKRIVFHCGNQPVVDIINSKRSKGPHIMNLVRNLTLLTLKYNFYFKAIYVPGKRNPMADSISRFQEDVFRSLAPNADLLPQPLPAV